MLLIRWEGYDDDDGAMGCAIHRGTAPQTWLSNRESFLLKKIVNEGARQTDRVVCYTQWLLVCCIHNSL